MYSTRLDFKKQNLIICSVQKSWFRFKDRVIVKKMKKSIWDPNSIQKRAEVLILKGNRIDL
jgi:hypothetical protein